MGFSVVKFPVENTDPIRLPNTKRMAFRSVACNVPYELYSMDFVDYFFLTLYWDRGNPMESVVELRCGTKTHRWSKTSPIDPKLLRKILCDMPRYRDALVDLAPGRSFFKGLCGEWVASLDRYDERVCDSLAGSLLQDKSLELAIALSFPGKIKSMFHASRVCDLIGKIDNFKREMSGNGSISSQIKEWKLSISRTKKAIQELDTYISEDYQQFERCKEVLGKFGIEYDMSEGEYESVNGF